MIWVQNDALKDRRKEEVLCVFVSNFDAVVAVCADWIKREISFLCHSRHVKGWKKFAEKVQL